MVQLDFGPVRATEHRGHDDLLSAGLGLAGLTSTQLPFLNPFQPSASEVRRRAIHCNWKGIADLGPLGGYGTAYGAVPDVSGREYQAFARLPHAREPHRVLLQLPDHFDRNRRCLVVSASSGSRGIYGAIALAGAWGLPRGCAVAYTDKGGGSGYFDPADDSGVALDGRRARRGSEPLEFTPPSASPGAGIAMKHVHSGDHPEAGWGRHVMQAAQFGLAMLDRAYPDQAPFTPQNTRIIATGLSNGGGAVLQAAGLDREQFFSGVVALEPNVHVHGYGRALYDYASEAAIWMPCALLSPRFDRVPFARGADGQPFLPSKWRCARLAQQGLLGDDTLSEQAEFARRYLHARGWTDEAMATAAMSTAFDLWRALSAGYASAYLRRGADDMPCGFRYAAMGLAGMPGMTDPLTRATWWAEGSGIAPGNGIGLFGATDMSSDPWLAGSEGLRQLWTGSSTEAQALRAAVAETAVDLPPRDLPLAVVHGASDGLLPVAFSSAPYIHWLQEHARPALFWKVPHAQHFDAFLALPGVGARHVPLLPFGYAALDRLWAHLYEGVSWSVDVPTPASQPRGAGALRRAALDLPA